MKKIINHKGHEILITDERVFGFPEPDKGSFRVYYSNDRHYYTQLIPGVAFKEENSEVLGKMLDSFLVEWFKITLK